MVIITKYVWDTVSDCVLSELDENNAVTAVYTNEPQQYGGVLSQRRGNTSHYHHHDALGSTRFLTDSSGNVTDTYLNDAWGNSVAQTGTTVNPFKWVGKYGYYTDDSTGQVYVRARMYQPVVARWVSADPLLFVDGSNCYAYVLNQVAISVDPTGLFIPPVGRELWKFFYKLWSEDDVSVNVGDGKSCGKWCVDYSIGPCSVKLTSGRLTPKCRAMSVGISELLIELGTRSASVCYNPVCVDKNNLECPCVGMMPLDFPPYTTPRVWDFTYEEKCAFTITCRYKESIEGEMGKCDAGGLIRPLSE